MALLFSRNCKKNLVCSEIWHQLNELGKNEVKHYMHCFPNKNDYNIVEYGNLLCYYDDVREMFKRCGYKTDFSNYKVWKYYKCLVHEVIQTLNNKIGYYK